MSERMPDVEVGIVVYWYPDGSRTGQPHPAMVTRIGHDNLTLNLFDPGNYNMMIRDGVRHVDDARAKSVELQEAGAWDFTPAHKRLLALEKKVEQLLK